MSLSAHQLNDQLSEAKQNEHSNNTGADRFYVIQYFHSLFALLSDNFYFGFEWRIASKLNVFA